MSRKVGERARTATVKRWTIYRSDAELHYTVRNMFYTIRAIRHALRYKSCHERYSPGMHCSWRCPYASLCQFMNNGDPWEEIAETLFVQEDPGERASWKERITSVAEGMCNAAGRWNTLCSVVRFSYRQVDARRHGR